MLVDGRRIEVVVDGALDGVVTGVHLVSDRLIAKERKRRRIPERAADEKPEDDSWHGKQQLFRSHPGQPPQSARDESLHASIGERLEHRSERCLCQGLEELVDDTFGGEQLVQAILNHGVDDHVEHTGNDVAGGDTDRVRVEGGDHARR